ncbi:MAG TPA: peroxiredoxin, partial [Longimicrobiales bacterium]|nr:peroxiredoxin [Longimicrobiales bacterium]
MSRVKKKGSAGPEKGEPAPDFTLPSDEGGEVTLSALRGRKVVLYFYPKDDTPGCTIEACEFRDALPRFDGLDAV